MPRHPVAAQPAVAADRFAREIVGFLTVCAALAAAERQPVRPSPFKRVTVPRSAMLYYCSDEPTPENNDNERHHFTTMALDCSLD
jgi:hypothetical protein